MRWTHRLIVVPLAASLVLVPGCPGNGTTTNPSPIDPDEEETITWTASATQVDSGTELELATNGTRVAQRDPLGSLHVVFTDATIVRHGVLAANASAWRVRPLTKLSGDSQVSGATLGIISNQLMLAAWMEQRGSQRSIAVTRSLNRGELWEPPLQIAQGNFDDAMSLLVFTRTGGNPGAVLAWHDAGLNRIVSSAWRGTLWAASDWTFPVALSTALFGATGNVSVGGSGQTVVAAWQDNRFNAEFDIFVAQSSDGGLNWSTDALLPVPAGTSAQGQSPSVAHRPSDRVYITFENQGNVYLVTSAGATLALSTPRLLGPGSRPHAAVNDGQVAATAWQHFTGNAADDSLKTLGLTVSLDDFASLTGPHAMPGSASVTDVVQPTVTLSGSAIDALWVDVSVAGSRVLRHRSGELP